MTTRAGAADQLGQPMAEDDKIGLLTATFRRPEIEHAYQSSRHERHLTQNLAGVLTCLALNLAYIAYDLAYFSDPAAACAIRLTVTAFSLILLASIKFQSSKDGHQVTFMAIVLALTFGVEAIIAAYPAEYDKLYIGLIQGSVLFSFILRLNFMKMVTILFLMIAGFVFAMAQTNDLDEVVRRTITLLIIGIICLAGVYLLQRYHRRDFLQARTIDFQNQQLSKLLSEVEADNKRKIAAMNLLVHFVRTPLHQIAGFSDIVLAKLCTHDDERPGPSEDLVESAQYIKDASSSLTANVTQLLEYHRLDELEQTEESDVVDMGDVLDTLCGGVPEENLETIERASARVQTLPAPMQICARRLGAFLAGRLAGEARVAARLSADADGATITLRISGDAFSEEQFAEKSKPLTAMNNYLTSDGSALGMNLRTARRAIEICGGELRYRDLADGYEIAVIAPDRPAANVRREKPDERNAA